MRDDDLTTARILIVDDQPSNVRLLERVLVTAGYQDLMSTLDPREVLERYRTFQPDLILLDLLMPYLDGVAVLEQLATEFPAGAFVPVIVLTADVTSDARSRALAAGAHDFLTKPFEQLEVVLRIRNLLNTRRLYLALERQNRSLDETVRERTERLLQSEKVATMGSLLAGVAHELNNPLAVLSGQAQLLRETVTEAALIRRAGKIGDAAERCVRIVRNFLALARQHPPERTEVSIPQVVQSAVELLAYELRTEGIEVALDVAVRLPALSADPHQLHQVLVNLIANAQQAMRRSPQPRRLAISASHDAARGLLCLTVADTGRVSRRRSAPASSRRSSRPSLRARARGSGCRSAGASSRSTAGRSTSTASRAGARASRSSCRSRCRLSRTPAPPRPSLRRRSVRRRCSSSTTSRRSPRSSPRRWSATDTRPTSRRTAPSP